MSEGEGDSHATRPHGAPHTGKQTPQAVGPDAPTSTTLPTDPGYVVTMPSDTTKTSVPEVSFPSDTPSAGQVAMHERQKKCAAEWKQAKADGKLEKGMKWPKFWSACNKRLKGAG